MIGYFGIHSKKSSQIAAAFSLAHLHNSCNGFRPFKLIASASMVLSVKSALATCKWPDRAATCNALSPSPSRASQSAAFCSKADITADLPASDATCSAVRLRNKTGCKDNVHIDR